ncbi:MAG: C25 family cysteine peptidase [Eubacteriales bacterium]|nr:C25 family cysteine peptidase [Eubacteriales bacterium]
MKKLCKKFVVLTLSVGLLTAPWGRSIGLPVLHVVAETKQSGTWIKSGDNWWYKYDDGSYPHSQWLEINQEWYFFDEAGWMKTGWLQHKSTWYYLKPNGVMAKGWLQVEGVWYYFRSSGAMVTGWLNLSGTWYFLESNGAMKKWWLEWQGRWYYLGANGAMVTGKTRVDGVDYNFSTNGSISYAGDRMMVAYGSHYLDGLNTLRDLDVIKSIVNYYGSDFKYDEYRNPGKDELTENDHNINAAKMNKGIFFFTGHGSVGAIKLGDGTRLYSNELPEMNNTSVAFFFACHSADSEQGNLSMVRSAVNKGAKSAYGYTDLSFEYEDRKLEQFILKKMFEGYSLSEAVNKARGQYYNFVVVQDNRIRLLGDVNTRLKRYQAKDSTYSLDEVIRPEIQKEFVKNGNIHNRYYNGVLTGDYYILNEEGLVTDFRCELTDEDLRVVQKVIDARGEGESYDGMIESMLEDNCIVSDKYTTILKDDNVKVIRHYYVKDRVDGQLKQRYDINVVTGEIKDGKDED